MEKHEMKLEWEHEGTEKWVCPECGKELLIEKNPWKKTTIKDGNIYALHSGSQGGIDVEDISIES